MVSVPPSDLEFYVAASRLEILYANWTNFVQYGWHLVLNSQKV